MKQFIVLCATLPLMLILMLQFSLDQINYYKVECINQIVYAKSEEAKQRGAFTESMASETVNAIAALGFSAEDITVDFDLDTEISSGDNIPGHCDNYIERGYPIHYYVEVKFNRPMAASLISDNYYYYVIDSYTASEYLEIAAV